MSESPERPMHLEVESADTASQVVVHDSKPAIIDIFEMILKYILSGQR